MMNRTEWANLFLPKCGFPVTTNNVVSLAVWMESERAATLPPDGALNNPLDTTEGWPNSTDFNSAGVKNYATVDDGLSATQKTLFNGDYGSIIAAFKGSIAPSLTVVRIAQSPWGSKPTP